MMALTVRAEAPRAAYNANVVEGSIAGRDTYRVGAWAIPAQKKAALVETKMDELFLSVFADLG